MTLVRRTHIDFLTLLKKNILKQPKQVRMVCWLVANKSKIHLAILKDLLRMVKKSILNRPKLFFWSKSSQAGQ